MTFKPFHEGEEVVRYQNHLPHWRQEGVTYFVTFRLGDAIPQAKLERWKQEREWWMEAHGLSANGNLEELPEEKRDEYHRRFTKTFHDWLDAGSGSCALRDSRCAEIVGNSLNHFSGERYDLGSWVVMPNHVHALVGPLANHFLQDILHSWKSFTAHAINKLLGLTGPFWQHESYDHIVRSEEQFAHYQKYIRENPLKAKLRRGEFLLCE
jgi:type I restriction enzyme R subunit